MARPCRATATTSGMVPSAGEQKLLPVVIPGLIRDHADPAKATAPVGAQRRDGASASRKNRFVQRHLAVGNGASSAHLESRAGWPELPGRPQRPVDRGERGRMDL